MYFPSVLFPAQGDCRVNVNTRWLQRNLPQRRQFYTLPQHNMGFKKIALSRMVCTCAVQFLRESFETKFSWIQPVMNLVVSYSPSCPYSGHPNVCTPPSQSRITLKLAPHATSTMGLPEYCSLVGLGTLVLWFPTIRVEQNVGGELSTMKI